MDDDGMNLTDEEAGCLAMLLAVRHLADREWLEWENVPNLGEYAFDRLFEAAERVTDVLMERSMLLDARMDIDSRYLFEQATKYDQTPPVASLKDPQ